MPRPRRPDAFAVSLRLADEDSICTLLERVIDRFGALDILVNNAGVVSWRPLLEQDFGELDARVNVNLLGVMKLTWCFLPLLTDAVITVGSTATLHQSRTPPPYCATKWGLRGFVKALAVERPGKRFADVVLQVARGDLEVEPGGDVDVREHADA